MIVFVNPRVCRPPHRRFPLSIMALGAALPSRHSWHLIDGNCPTVDPGPDVEALVDSRRGGPDPVRVVAMTVMPGPQLANAVPLARRWKTKYPDLTIVWGGYFPSLYPKPVLDAPYVDWMVRGQGEATFIALLDLLERGGDPDAIAGLAYRRPDGSHAMAPERPWIGPDELAPPPYDRIDVEQYIHPTVLGHRSAVYQASIGCPYGCNFCGVIAAYGSRQRVETPTRTVNHLLYLVRNHGVDSIHFYDNNFFLTEERAVELAERMTPLGLGWWCEARIDAMHRFSDATWRRLKQSGLRMVFFGAESGSDDVLRQMGKQLTIEKTLDIAAKTREHGIVPEFSFVLGNPIDPERDVEDTLGFVRRLKGINPTMELITYFYTPTPQRRDTYGDVDPVAGTPRDLDAWTSPEWVDWMTHENPRLSWMSDRLKARVEDFETVLKSRFPSVHDTHTRGWGKALARVLAEGRWRRAAYDDPRWLKRVRTWAAIRKEDRQEYGHLRPAAS